MDAVHQSPLLAAAGTDYSPPVEKASGEMLLRLACNTVYTQGLELSITMTRAVSEVKAGRCHAERARVRVKLFRIVLACSV